MTRDEQAKRRHKIAALLRKGIDPKVIARRFDVSLPTVEMVRRIVRYETSEAK